MVTPRTLKAVQNVLLAVGILTFVILLSRLDVGVVQAALMHVGWGIALIVGQEMVAHVLNALGWRFAFAPEYAAAFPMRELVRARISGDAINYLTPSATIAGEVARTVMLKDAHGTAVRAASVVVAKSTQTLGQVVFVAGGLLLLGAWRMVPLAGPGLLVAGITGAAVITALVVQRSTTRWGAALRALGGNVRPLLRHHPDRVMASTLMFLLAYSWGTVEAYWICRLLLVPVSVVTALTIEVLSVTVDGMLFVVPAKIGTQEGGKMAIFTALGLSPSLGFAFGVVRHIRELTWAAFGILLCWCQPRPRNTKAA